MAIKVFPVDAPAHPQFADAFGSHRGTDIFAPAGSPLLAVDSGDARADVDPKGGNVIYLRADDGTVYYYAHLQDYTGSFPRRVSMSEQIGTVGTTGNAQGKDPHLHFEVHPDGSSVSVDPYPLLLDTAPAGSLRLAVPKMPLPANPLGPTPTPTTPTTPTKTPVPAPSRTPPKKKAPAEPPGLWFWAWGQLLQRRISGHARSDETLQPTGEL
jgi:hypothetical protein